MSHRTRPISFLMDTGFLHVGQAGVELLTSSDLPALASQIAGIIGMNYTPGQFLTSITNE